MTDDELRRHLPGRHNQKRHGNRFKTPGDKSSGYRHLASELHGHDLAEHADGKHDHAPVPAKKADQVAAVKTAALEKAAAPAEKADQVAAVKAAALEKAAAPAAGAVPVADVKPGTYATVAGVDMLGNKHGAAGWVAGVRKVRWAPNRQTKARDMYEVRIAEHSPDNDRREMVFVDPKATATVRELSPPVMHNGKERPAGWLDAAEMLVKKNRGGFVVDAPGPSYLTKPMSKRDAEEWIRNAAATRRGWVEDERRQAAAAEQRKNAPQIQHDMVELVDQLASDQRFDDITDGLTRIVGDIQAGKATPEEARKRLGQALPHPFDVPDDAPKALRVAAMEAYREKHRPAAERQRAEQAARDAAEAARREETAQKRATEQARRRQSLQIERENRRAAARHAADEAKAKAAADKAAALPGKTQARVDQIDALEVDRYGDAVTIEDILKGATRDELVAVGQKYGVGREVDDLANNRVKLGYGRKFLAQAIDEKRQERKKAAAADPAVAAVKSAAVKKAEAKTAPPASDEKLRESARQYADKVPDWKQKRDAENADVLAGMSPADQQRIRNAVADRGPEIYASPMVGGSRSDVGRYLAEGELGKQLADRHDWRTVWKAVTGIVNADPALVEQRNPAQAKADAAARTARVDALVEQAQQALKTDKARTVALLDEALAIDPDAKLAEGSRRGHRLSEVRESVAKSLAKGQAESRPATTANTPDAVLADLAAALQELPGGRRKLGDTTPAEGAARIAESLREGRSTAHGVADLLDAMAGLSDRGNANDVGPIITAAAARLRTMPDTPRRAPTPSAPPAPAAVATRVPTPAAERRTFDVPPPGEFYGEAVAGDERAKWPKVGSADDVAPGDVVFVTAGGAMRRGVVTGKEGNAVTVAYATELAPDDVKTATRPATSLRKYKPAAADPVAAVKAAAVQKVEQKRAAAAATELTLDGAETTFAPAPRSAIGLADRPNVGRDTSPATQQLGLFANTSQEETQGQGALLDAMFNPADLTAGFLDAGKGGKRR